MLRYALTVGVLLGALTAAVPAVAEDLRGGSIDSKLDALLQKQDRILQELDQMREELNVIKIRASQS